MLQTRRDTNDKTRSWWTDYRYALNLPLSVTATFLSLAAEVVYVI